MDTLKEYLPTFVSLLSAIGIIIPAVRKWWIKPLLEKLDRHADQHEAMELELRRNGFDERLPPAERGLSLRELVITTRVAQRLHNSSVDEYGKELTGKVDRIEHATTGEGE